VTGFGSFDSSRSKRALGLMETSYLRLRELVIERITDVTFGMNSRGGDDGSCLGIEVKRVDTSKLTDMVIARKVGQKRLTVRRR